MQNKKVIELFAGKQSFSKVAQELGFVTFTTDKNDLNGIDYVVDILNFDFNRVPFIPDILWASPDCSVFSKASGNIHFDSKKLKPKTEKAKMALKIIDKTLEIIQHYLNINPNLKYYIENPVGRLIKYLQQGKMFDDKFEIPRIITVDQCQYGREYQKATYLFTNDFCFKVRKRCPGIIAGCHHKRNIKDAGSGLRKSFGDNQGYYERAKIPYQLCFEILYNFL